MLDCLFIFPMSIEFLASHNQSPTWKARATTGFLGVLAVVFSVRLIVPALAEPARGQPLFDRETRDGGIVRGPTSARRIAFVFTGHEFAEGGETILGELARHKGKGSFFFTGDFLAATNFAPLI